MFYIKKYLTNWGYYAYLTYGDMCDMEDMWYLGIGDLGKMITRLKIDVLYYPYKPILIHSLLITFISSKIYLWITRSNLCITMCIFGGISL